MLDVIIVGAGFSGIAAARKLHQANKTFLVLEARDRIGGRVYTKQFPENLYLDLGGQWIGSSQTRMYELCEEYQINLFETYNKGYNILEINGQIRKYKGLIPKMNLLSLLNLDWVLKKLDRMAKKITVSDPWNHPKAKVLDQTKLSDFISKYCLTKESHQVVKYALETVLAIELSKISLLHALFYIKSGHSLQALISIKDGAQQHRAEGGMQLLAEKMAALFKDQIRFGHAVTSIIQNEESVTVQGENFSFSCKKVIMAVPPPLINDIRFSPELSTLKKQIISGIYMGKVGKCFMVYQKPFWRENDFSGQALADEDSPFQTMFDSSPNDGGYGIILGFTIADRAEEYFRKPEAKRKQLMLEKLHSYFGEEALQPIMYQDIYMTDEAWSQGCYAGIYPLGAWTGFQNTYVKPEGNIFWAGTESSDQWYGYIEGAVRAGERAVGELGMED